MSTDADKSSDGDHTPPEKITLALGESRELWVARDKETGVASQGTTRQDALENLDKVVAGYHGAGEPPTNKELRELGVDPDENASGELPDVLK